MVAYAIVRPPGNDAHAGLTTQTGAPLDTGRLKEQHRRYCAMLSSLGVKLIHLKPEPGFPDGYFVEDTAVVTPEVAVISRPGAPQRRGEEKAVAEVLSAFRPLRTIVPPGTLDGGDVLMAGRQVFVGLSGRTNAEGADQLRQFLFPHGYRCLTVPVADGLHLKSSVNVIGNRRLVMVASWAGRSEFSGYDKILVPPAEAHACNALWLNGHLVVPAGYPETRAKLEATGEPLIFLDTGEIHRMDGGLTCLSIRF